MGAFSEIQIQYSLRRMFVTMAIERGVDVKVIASWQGHRDGGALILRTYSHVRPEHALKSQKAKNATKLHASPAQYVCTAHRGACEPKPQNRSSK
jgi:integrase